MDVKHYQTKRGDILACVSKSHRRGDGDGGGDCDGGGDFDGGGDGAGLTRLTEPRLCPAWLSLATVSGGKSCCFGYFYKGLYVQNLYTYGGELLS